MEPENSTPVPEGVFAEGSSTTNGPEQSAMPQPDDREPRGLRWAFIGPNGLRAGWSVLLFFAVFILLAFGLGTGARYIDHHVLHTPPNSGMTVKSSILGEGTGVLALLLAAFVVALIERRRVLDFNLSGSGRLPKFAGGLVAGFAALSALVGGLAAGGWLHFGPVALSGARIAEYAAGWGVAFFLVGCMEEGMFRCYMQFTLTRGINFWWALGIVGAICIDLVLRGKGNGIWGVYAMALLGLLPCAWLHFSRAERSSFWQAAWVTSTLFGFVHTGNNGENWIGIFAAAAIGFVFCVSVYVTGSAWWAIGCHAAWDWAETYFYGTADSGFVAKGHFLTTTAAGNSLWSGGADGPEGSLLVLGAILLLLLGLVVFHRMRQAAVLPATAAAGQLPA